MTLRIDPTLSYLSFPAKIEVLPADFTPEPGSDAGKLIAVRDRLEDERFESFDRYSRVDELIEEAGLPNRYAHMLYFSSDFTFLRYTPAGASHFQGELEVTPLLPGGYYATVYAIDVVPSSVGDLNLGELLGFDSLQLRKNDSSVIPGSICFCMTNGSPTFTEISASFDGDRLIIDYEETSLLQFPDWIGAVWIGDPPPPEFFAEGRASTTYHLVADVVPLPAALWLFAPAIGGLGLMQKKSVSTYRNRG